MDYQEVSIRNHTIQIPVYYQKVDSLPDDPEESIPFMIQTENASCFVLAFPIPLTKAMPQDKEVVISSIRSFMGANQGLIQVEADDDKVYSIVKTLKQEGGVQYTLTCHKYFQDCALCIQGFFDEIGTTGLRDTIVYEMCRRNNLVGTEDEPFKGWTCDPYDASIREGALMNLSEQEIYDDKFPDFPLSMCRELVRML